MAERKISELESTTDLQDLYTIGTDKNNNSKKVKLQFLQEAADYANAQGDYAKGVADNSAGNIGISDYPVFSESGSYAVGNVVNYNGKLYRFSAPHQSGAWNGNDVVPTSINAESQRKLTELSEEIAPITGSKLVRNFHYTEMLTGAVGWGGVIEPFGIRTEPIAIKGGSSVKCIGFSGTPSYIYVSEWKDGTLVQNLYWSDTIVGEQPIFVLDIKNDAELVFSTGSENITIEIKSSGLTEDVKKLNNEIKDAQQDIENNVIKINNLEENVNESLAKIEADIEEISKELEPLKGEVQTLNFHYTEMLQGAVSYGKIQAYGLRTEPIAVKKGDTIIASGFNGTSAYDFASEWKDGVYEKALYRTDTSGGNQEFTLAIDEDKEVVFSTSSENITIEIQGSNVISSLQQDIEKKPNIQDLNFFGFAVDTTASVYEYDRKINLPNFALKAGSSFVLQTGEVLFFGYADSERVATINVNGTGAKRIFLDGTLIQPKYSWEKGDMLFLYYDGEDYQATGLFGQSKSNALWNNSIGTSAIDLYDTAEEVESPIPSYYACKVSVTKGTILYINTSSSAGIALISQIEEDGTIKELEYGSQAYTGYRVGEFGYIYEVANDMDLRITYGKQNKPKIFAFTSYLTSFIESAKTSIAKLLIDIATKASISEVNKKASAADLAAETAARQAAIQELQRQINEFDFSGDIEQVVKDYIAEHPESVTSIQDNTITEAKFTDDVRKKKASYYPNVAAMVADTTLEIGMTAITKGYYAENDGGAGQYTIVARQTENGGSYISLNNGLTASLNFDGQTYILSQWGVRGDGVIRNARETFPFLMTSDIKEVNPYFDDSVSDASYMIQYLINQSEYRNAEVIIDGKEYPITHTIFLKSMVTLTGIEVAATRSSWVERETYYCRSSLVMKVGGLPMFAGDKYFDAIGNGYSNIQQVCLKNFNARGTFGNDDVAAEVGSFLDSRNMSLSRCRFENVNVARFATAFNVIEQCYWSIFSNLGIYQMKDNGIYFGYNENVETSGQKNANSIMDCVIFGCGMDYDKTSKQYINKYGATSDSANRLPIDKPTPQRGNCIVVSYSGNYISNCDVSDAAVGVYRAEYSEGTTIVGLYSEGIAMAQIYNDYTEGNPNSAELGGYLRTDQWTDSKGNIHQNKRVANPNDFVE